MLNSTIRMTVPAERRDGVLAVLSSVASWCRIEPGCIACRVYQDAEVESAIMLEQHWESREDLERHLRSEEFRKVLVVVEMSLEPPEIRFEEISSSTGIEAIEKARSHL